MVNPDLLVNRPQNFQGYNPADRDAVLFETPKPSVVNALFVRFGIVAYEVAPHILVVDLSHWNGDVSFRLLRESGVVAVILKCSEGAENTYYEYKDVKFELFWRQALDWGFPIMLYHFFRGEKGSQEFNWFLKCSDAFMNDTRILGKTAVYLDTEWKPSSMARSTYTNRAFGFTSLTTGRGFENGIYCSPGLVPTLFDPALALWDTVNQWNAHWTAGEDTLPLGWTEERRNVRQRGIYDTHWWVEKVLGAGKVDINHMFYANETALRQWLGQGAAMSPSASPSPTLSFSWSPSASYSPSSAPDCCDEHALRLDTIDAGMQVLTEIQNTLISITKSHEAKINLNAGRIDQNTRAIETLTASLQSLSERVDAHNNDIAEIKLFMTSLDNVVSLLDDDVDEIQKLIEAIHNTFHPNE